MAKYRKKPIVIEAWVFDGLLDSSKTLPQEIKDAGNSIRLAQDGTLRIATLEGDMFANVGDFIIKGIKGEIYPCKPDIFEATYELAEESIETQPISQKGTCSYCEKEGKWQDPMTQTNVHAGKSGSIYLCDGCFDKYEKC